MARHARDKLTRQLGEHATTVLIEGGQLMPDAEEPDRIIWTTKSPSSWPKWARELWAHRDRSLI